VANPIRLDPRGLSALLHAAQQMPNDTQPAAPASSPSCCSAQAMVQIVERILTQPRARSPARV